jgi:hypothetical protein
VTPQEEQLLNSLAERVNQTQLQEKDPDAEALLTRELGSNPDAIYILAQTVLVQNVALEQAKAQMQAQASQLQQARQPARATSFLGNLLGHRDPAPPSQPTYIPPPPPPPEYMQPQYQPAYQQPQYAPMGQPSFMRGAMQTAAGVAAGALAFEGVESILHGLGGFGHGYGWGGSGMGMGGFGMGPGMGMMGGGGLERPVEETVVNNYYDQPGGGQEHFEHGGEERHFHETADQGGSQFSDASYNTSGDDQGSYDNSGVGDSGGFDSVGGDNSGGFDSGGGFDDGGGGGGDLL